MKSMITKGCEGLWLAGLLAAPVAAYAQVTYQLDLPSQELKSSLSELARQARINIVFDPAAVKNYTAPALKGSYELGPAIAKLLQGTGFVAEFTDASTVVVKQRPPKPQPKPDRPAPAKAPETQAVQQPETMEAVVVTGSRLKRLGGEGPSPVTVLDPATIERSGGATIRDVLRLVPQASVNPSEITGFLGSAPIQLRGLSIGTTLVLVNGHRVSPSGANGVTVDVASIPLAAVDRIEIVSDGGSAVYGSDAIGGVVNIILKEKVDGTHVSVRYGSADDGKAAERQASLTWGHKGDRLSTTFAIDVLARDPLLFRDRDPTNNMDFRRFGGNDFRQPYTTPGTVHSLDGSPLPGLTSPYATIPSNSSGKLVPSDFLPTQGVASLSSEYFANRQLQPETKRVGILSNTKLALSDTVTASLELLASENRGKFTLVEPFVATATVVPASNPYNPFGVDVGVNRLLTGVEPDRLENTDRFYSAVAGLRGMFNEQWDWNAAVLFSQDTQRATERNYLDDSAIQAALRDPDPSRTLNLFTDGPVASPDVLAHLLPTNQRRYQAREIGTELGVSGNVFQLPAGAVEVYAGLETRHSELDQESIYDNNNSSRNSYSVYSEVLVPVASSVNLTAALRQDHYNDFGGTLNPKLGLEWNLTDDLRLRSSYGTSFKAPNLFDLHGVRFEIPSTVVDPQRGNDIATIQLTAGGNPNLKPEKAKSYTLGLGYGFDWGYKDARVDLSIDGWRINQSARIVTPDPQTLVNYESLFPDRIVRDAPTPADVAAGRPGVIRDIDGTAINFGRSLVQGVDLRARLRMSLGAGSFTLRGDATYVDKYQAELTPGQVQNRVGNYSAEGYAPRWKATLAAGYELGPWTLEATARYVDSYRYLITTVVKASTQFDVVASYEFKDVSDASLLSNTKVSIGAVNAFDRSPPFMNYPFGYDPRQYTNVGRFLYAKLDKRF